MRHLVLALGLTSSAVAGAAPVAPNSLLALDPRVQNRDADGTLTTVGGFNWRSGTTVPAAAALAFARAHGLALGIEAPLKVSAVHRIGQNTVVRMHEELNNVPVINGGLSVVVGPEGNVTLASRGTRVPLVVSPFVLDRASVAHVASGLKPMLAPLELTEEVIEGLMRPVYVAVDGAPAIPAFVVVLPSLNPVNSLEVVVSAEDGTVLSVKRMAKLEAPTAAQVFDPNPGEQNSISPVAVTLPNLLESTPQHLTGRFVETANCCKRYECAGGDGGCELKTCVSATQADAGVESRVPFSFPTALLPIPAGIGGLCPSLPQTLYVDSVFCAELPKAQPIAGGWLTPPMDKSMPAADALLSEEDDFAEVMMYYHVDKFQQHIRSVTQNANYCLTSQACNASGVPANPFTVVANGLFPNISQSSFQSLLTEICVQGKGGSAANPVKINSYMRVDNAAFIPASDPSANPFPINIPILNRTEDSLVFYQGANRDFAYDGDVIYHEFTHAVVHTGVTNAGQPAGLNGAFRDHWGVHNSAGALNEGYADFFSESLTDDPVTGEYAAAGLVQGEVGIRNAGALWTCPDSTTGEVHDDSRAWSSALWAARTALGGNAIARRMEKAVYTAMVTLPVNASFGAATTATKATLLAEFPGKGTEIDAAFTSRGVQDCVRARTVVRRVGNSAETVQVDRLQLMGKQEAGLANFAPGHMQFKLELPPRTKNFTISFGTQAGGLIAGLFGAGGGTVDLAIVVKADEPVVNTYTATQASHDGISESVTPDQNGLVEYNVEVADSSGLTESQVYYVSVDNRGNDSVVLSAVDATLELAPVPDAGQPEADAGSTSSSSSSGGGGDAPPGVPSCACAAPASASPAGLLGLLVVGTWVGLRRRR